MDRQWRRTLIFTGLLASSPTSIQHAAQSSYILPYISIKRTRRHHDQPRAIKYYSISFNMKEWTVRVDNRERGKQLFIYDRNRLTWKVHVNFINGSSGREMTSTWFVIIVTHLMDFRKSLNLTIYWKPSRFCVLLFAVLSQKGETSGKRKK